MLTEAQLKTIMPNCSSARVATCLQPLNAAMHRFGVDTPLRAAAFVAQLAHESGELRWLEELWGPTPAQRRYEPASSVAAQLGNTRRGDGLRFKGRGPIQITGRANYARYGSLLGIDLVAEPEQAADPDVGFAIAGLYWASNRLNELADAEKFVAITRRINGGTNGLADRQKYYARAKQALAGGIFGDEPPRPRGARRIELAVPLEDVPPLPRGSETLRLVAGDAGGAAAGRGAASKARAAGGAAVGPVTAQEEGATPAATDRGAARKAGAGKAAKQPSAGTGRAAAKRAAGREDSAAASVAGSDGIAAKRAAGTAGAAAKRAVRASAKAVEKPGDGATGQAAKREAGAAKVPRARRAAAAGRVSGADDAAGGAGAPPAPEDAASLREAVAARQQAAAAPAARAPAARRRTAARRPDGG